MGGREEGERRSGDAVNGGVVESTLGQYDAREGGGKAVKDREWLTLPLGVMEKVGPLASREGQSTVVMQVVDGDGSCKRVSKAKATEYRLGVEGLQWCARGVGSRWTGWANGWSR